LDKVAELKAEYEKAMESYKAGEVEAVCLLFYCVDIYFLLFVYCFCSFVLTRLILVQNEAGSDKETATKVEEELTDEE